MIFRINFFLSYNFTTFSYLPPAMFQDPTMTENCNKYVYNQVDPVKYV